MFWTRERKAVLIICLIVFSFPNVVSFGQVGNPRQDEDDVTMEIIPLSDAIAGVVVTIFATVFFVIFAGLNLDDDKKILGKSGFKR